MYSVVLFHSSNFAIWASKILRSAQIEHRMVPVPRHLSSDCGYCVRCPTEHQLQVQQLLQQQGVEFDQVVPLEP